MGGTGEVKRAYDMIRVTLKDLSHSHSDHDELYRFCLTHHRLSPPSLQTDTGVIYGVWTGEWAAKVLHQGPSGRVQGVALSPAAHRPLLAATTHNRYLLVTYLPQVRVL